MSYDLVSVQPGNEKVFLRTCLPDSCIRHGHRCSA